MKRLAILACVIMLAACGNYAKIGTIRIGWLGSLTGSQSNWGVSEYNTLNMLIKDINAKGGIKVGTETYKLTAISYDTASDPDEAGKSAQRLAREDKVLAILGPSTSKSALTMAQVLEAEKIPAIATMATNPKVTVDGRLKPYSFRVCFIDPYQGAVAANYAYDVIGARKAATLYDSSDGYSSGMSEIFTAEFVRKGGEIVCEETFKSDCVDFRPQLSNIKAMQPDIIFMPYFYKEVSLSTRQAREIGIHQTMMGGDGWPSDELISNSGGAVEGCYFVTHVDYNDPDIAEYKESYKKMYNMEPDVPGYLLHDAFLMLIEAIKAAGTPEREAVTKALAGLDIRGITGHIKINPATHDPEGKEAAIIKIVNGTYEFQQKYAVK